MSGNSERNAAVMGMGEKPLPEGLGLHEGSCETAGWDQRSRLGRLAAAFAEELLAERDRWALWLPVGIGVGIGLYFLLPEEPAAWLGLIALAGALALASTVRRRPAVFSLLLATAALAAGFSAAQIRTSVVAAPVIGEGAGPVSIEGRISAVEHRDAGGRITLERPRIAGEAPERTPVRVRLVVRDIDSSWAPGQWVRLKAVLTPPPEPAAPGAFDFQRHAWFQRLGGIGYAVGPVQAMTPPQGEAKTAGWKSWIARLRHSVQARIMAAIAGDDVAARPAALLATALIVGDVATLPENVMAAMRDSGLAHLLSISGLHVGLVALIVMTAVRGGLALVEPVALRRPIKKWAAATALATTFAYMLLAGAPVPTQRAFIMAAIALLAIAVDRSPFSMRTVAWAAVAVLLLQPESLLGASFQMSFAAVVALIAAYEGAGGALARWRGEAGWSGRILLYLGGVLFTTLVAGMATAPFAAHHFNRFAVYGLIANLLAVPLTALVVMPLAVAGMFLMPFGLEALALLPMGWGVEGIIAVARMVAGWPGAVAIVPATPTAGLILVSLGGLWLCLWRRNWRLLGLPLMALGVTSILWSRPPDILVDGGGRQVAVRTADGALAFSTFAKGALIAETWLRRAGTEDRRLWPKTGLSDDGRLSCDVQGCLYRVNGRTAAIVHDGTALEEDCGVADVIVADDRIGRRACPGGRAIIIDRIDLWRDGAHAIWLDEAGPRIESVRSLRGGRPWVRPLESRRSGKGRKTGAARNELRTAGDQ